MVTITKLEPKTFGGKPNGFKVTLSTGVEGNLQEKESDKELKVGESVEATVQDYISKSKGTHSNLITLKRISQGGAAEQQLNNQNPFPLPDKTPLSVQDKIGYKVEAAIKSMDIIMQVFTAERIEWDVVKTKQRECVETLWSEIDEIFAQR